MKEIVVVSPFAAMTEIARRVVADHGFDNVVLFECDLADAEATVRGAIGDGARVIVSRGGLFQRLREAFDVPAIEVEVTAFDLIESFEAARREDAAGPVGVVGFRSVIEGAETIARILGVRALCAELTGGSDLDREVQALVAQGVRMFVGDGNVAGPAARFGCRWVLVNSGAQAIHAALEQARAVLQASKQEKEKAQQFATIIDFVHDGIIAVDGDGRITVFNSASEKITGHSRGDALGRNIGDVIPDTRLMHVLASARPELGAIQRLDDKTVIATNRIPVVVDGEVRGAVATYQDITEVQNLEQAIRIRLAERGFEAQYTFADIVHRSAPMATCIRMAEKFAKYDTSVLLCGPSGVGKELFAQGIHNAGRRRHSPFVAINCAALPESLIESELFGYVEGSFTGATKKGKAGLFEMAHGGTIFLDEISEVPLILQGRLLRVLQEKQVMRLGDTKLIPVDVRVVCATNRDLRALVARNLFRGDLYFRVAILSLYIPSLNDRDEDIELLGRHFVEEYGSRYRKGRIRLTAAALAYLRAYRYEGNVRELQGMIERAVVVCDDEAIDVEHLTMVNRLPPEPGAAAGANDFPDGASLRDLEDWYIRRVYRQANGSIKESSAILGIDRTTLWRRIKERPLDET
jgi:PAS domain S-box-containing protein